MSDKIAFSNEELTRYDRHIIIPEFGMAGQEKLKAARVLVIGAGGLGSPVLQYLAAAGVGTIGIVDYDVVDASNLQRQVLFGMKNVGRPKTEAAKERLLDLNPHISVQTHNVQLTSQNALDIIRDYDVVADGTDNFPARYLVNDACVLAGKVNVYASIFRFDGQVSVFNYADKNGKRGPNYRDLFPAPPPPGLVPSCAEGGVLGVLPGIIGSLQAGEVIKVVTGIGEPLSGRLFLFDALSFETRTLKVAKTTGYEITKLIDYEQFCGLKKTDTAAGAMKEITVQELKAKMDRKEVFQLIDVREPHEYKIVNLGGELLPLSQLPGIDLSKKLVKDKTVVVHCKTGGRSAKAIGLIRAKYGLDNLYNLKGGITAYAKEIDTSLPTY